MRFHSEKNQQEIGPVWMSPGEIAKPYILMEQFCDDYTMADCRFYLWQMISASVSAESHHVAAPAGDQIYFFENLMPVVEALFLVTGRTGETNTKAATSGKDLPESAQTVQFSGQGEVLVQAGGYSGVLCRRAQRKCNRYLRKNSLWFDRKIDNPQQTISRFFGNFPDESYKMALHTVFAASQESDLPTRPKPGDTLSLFENLESLINASYVIFKAGNAENSLYDEIEGFFDYRSLKEWKDELGCVYIRALADSVLADTDSWPVYNRLTALIDALAAAVKKDQPEEDLRTNISLSRNSAP